MNVAQLRKISGIKNLAEFKTSAMLPTGDPSQYGNQKGLSTQHYLVRLIHQILTAADRNKQKESKTVLMQMIDWEKAFDKQCHTLWIMSFVNYGVRKSLIPILISYFQNGKMAVKWNGQMLQPNPLPGGGA